MTSCECSSSGRDGGGGGGGGGLSVCGPRVWQWPFHHTATVNSRQPCVLRLLTALTNTTAPDTATTAPAPAEAAKNPPTRHHTGTATSNGLSRAAGHILDTQIPQNTHPDKNVPVSTTF